MQTQVSKKLFTVGEYHRMFGVGILQEHDRLELIDGEIIEMSPIGHRHWVCTNWANLLFIESLGRRAVVGIQGPARLSDWSEPQPDVAIFKPRPDLYAAKKQEPEDLLLVIEVADSSLTYDRDVKVPRYARAGIPEAWIEDLKNGLLLVYRDPIGGTYTTSLTLGRTDLISSIAFPDVSFKVEDLLGGPPLTEPFE
jgi:Uma2 family endonuclease